MSDTIVSPNRPIRQPPSPVPHRPYFLLSMSLSRHLLLRASRSPWLARQLSERAFFRRAVRRFMPGEDLDAALAAAAELVRDGIGSVLTQLGEQVTSRDEAAARSFLWIDMEESRYVDATLELFQAVRAAHTGVGVCLQAYLRRTPADLEALLPLAPAIRLVKGAYNEPPDVALPKKRDVDAAYAVLAGRLLERAARGEARAVLGTHDLRLIACLRERALGLGAAPGGGAYEVHMLYGIRAAEQRALQSEGVPVRVLISYGTHWFPWYMRRLAERPANVWFVVRHLLG